MRLRRGSRGATDPSQGRSPAVENLHLSLAQMRTALNSLPMGVIVVEQTGAEWWRNRAAHDMLDAVADGGVVRDSITAMSRRVLRGSAERTHLTIDGPPPRTIEVRTVPLVNGGGLLVLEDITERELTDKVRTDFVANISHELKTPVGAMSLLAETIMGELADVPAARSLEPLVQRVVNESQRVSRIIDDLLELASIEFRGAVRGERVSLRSAAGEAVGRVQPFADAKSITMVREFGSDDVAVSGDPAQIGSAIGNLVENAVKYTDPGGRVTVTVSSDGQSAVVSVADTGAGIAPEHLDRIFERFYRVDPGRSRETGGTGLGLAIVRHVAENHGGEVNVTSTQGEGTTFTLRLPLLRG